MGSGAGAGFAGVGGEEERDLFRPRERRLMQQHTLQELGEPLGEARRTAGAAGENEERSAVLAVEAEAFPSLRPAARVLAQQHEIAVVGDQHKPVFAEITAHLFAEQLYRQVCGDIDNLHHAPLGRLSVRPFLRRMPPRNHEQAHVGEAGAAIAQVRHAEHARLQFLADRVQRPGQRAIVANFAGARTRGANAGDFRKVVGEDLRHWLAACPCNHRFASVPDATM